METDYENNVTQATQALKFTQAELEGVPADFCPSRASRRGPMNTR